MSHNVRRKPSAIDAALARAQSETAPVVLLQEICRTDMARIKADNPTWSVAWVPDVTQTACPNAEVDGNVAIWRGGSDGATRTLVYNAQRVRPSDGVRKQAGVACVLFNTNYRACSIHLDSGADSISDQQAAQTRNFAQSWVDTGKVVILGGDFNANPSLSTMDYFYRNGSNGDYYEVSRNADGQPCRCGGNTVRLYTDNGAEVQPRQIDYIFVSAGSYAPGLAASRDTDITSSDHLLLYGTARITQP